MTRLLLTLLCLLAPVALGATQLDALRSGAASARSQVSATRASQLQAQGELNKLAARIEQLKAQARGKLTPGSELDGALKHSQELSAVLTSAAAQLSTQEAALESANLALLGELSTELSRLRADFDRQSDRTARTQLIGKMRALRHEREQVRATLPAAKVPALEAVKPSDDPEDLLEQADLAKDNEDKVRKQLEALDRRIAEVKEERALDTRVRQFLGDNSIFDDSDRRLRVTRTVTEQPPAASSSDSAVGAFGSNRAPDKHVSFSAGAGTDSTPPTGFTNPSTQSAEQPVPGGMTGTQAPSPSSLGGGDSKSASPPPVPSSPTTRTVTGSDQRPQVGNHVAGRDEDDDLEDLEVQRTKLKGLADELKARAASLQKQAAQLK